MASDDETADLIIEPDIDEEIEAATEGKRGRGGGGGRFRSPFSRSNGFPSGFRLEAAVFCFGMLLLTVVLAAYFLYVHTYIVWTQESSAPIELSRANVPFYAASAPIMAQTSSKSERYVSFDYFVWMTDYLLLLLPPYVIGVFLFSVLFTMSSVGSTGITIVGIVFFLLQLSKGVYWTLIWANTSASVSCINYQMCISHNPGVAVGSPSLQFIVAIFVAYATALLSVLLLLVPGMVKRADLPSLSISESAAKRGSDFSFAVVTETQQRPTKRTSIASAFRAPPPTKKLF